MATPKNDRFEFPGRLFPLSETEIFGLLLKHYSQNAQLVESLVRLYHDHGGVIAGAASVADERQNSFTEWCEAHSSAYAGIGGWCIPPGTGSYHDIETWDLLADEQTSDALAYRGAVVETARHWMRGAPWGEALIHASLVAWDLSPPLRKRQELSIGVRCYQRGVAMPLLRAEVYWDPETHRWPQVQKRMAEAAEKAFRRQEQALKAIEDEFGVSLLEQRMRVRNLPPSDANTFSRDVRWLFLTMCPFPPEERPVVGVRDPDEPPRPYSTREIAEQDDQELSTVDHALSALRRDMSMSHRPGS